MPVTRLNSLTSSLVTRFSARAPIRCTVEISSSTRVSVISRHRQCSSAASSVSFTRSGCSRRWTATRPRPGRASRSRPSARRRRTDRPGSADRADRLAACAISVSIVSRLTLPASDRIDASTDGPSSSRRPSPAGDQGEQLETASHRSAPGRDPREQQRPRRGCNADRTIRSIAAARRRLDPLAAAAGHQLLTHPITGLRSTWVTFVDQPLRQRFGVGHACTPETPAPRESGRDGTRSCGPTIRRTRSRSHPPRPAEPRNRLRRPGFRPAREGTGLFQCRSATTARSRASSPHAYRPPDPARRRPTSNGRSAHPDPTPEPRAEATPSTRRS